MDGGAVAAVASVAAADNQDEIFITSGKSGRSEVGTGTVDWRKRMLTFTIVINHFKRVRCF